MFLILIVILFSTQSLDCYMHCLLDSVDGFTALLIKERGGGQIFSTSFWMRFSQALLCHYRFKFIFDDIIFLLSGNIIEYICFWRFNSIIMTWNKWLVFTKSVIIGLNNISPWPCPLGFVCLPCVLHDSFQHLSSSCDPLVYWYVSRFVWRRSLVRYAHNTL